MTWLGPAVLLVGLAVTFALSATTGLSPDEARRVQAIEHARSLPRAVADTGLGATVSWAAQGLYRELMPFGVWPSLLSVWASELAGATRPPGSLIAHRFGWLLILGLAPGALYHLVEGRSGPRVAVLTAFLPFAMPGWAKGVGTASEAAIVGTLWLVLGALYVGARQRRPAGHLAGRLANFAFGVAVPACATANLAALWVLPPIVAHSLVAERSANGLGRGQVKLPFGFVWCLVLAPLVVAISAPQVWRGGAVAVAEWLFAPLSPTVDAAATPGRVVSVDRIPLGHAFEVLGTTTPIPLLVAALVGALLHAWQSARYRSAIARKETGGGYFLAASVLLGFALGPLVTPRVFLRFPPRVEAALPFLAAFAAIGVNEMANRAVRFGRSIGDRVFR